MNNFGNQFMNSGSYPYQDNSTMYQQRLNSMAQQVTGQSQPQNSNFNGNYIPYLPNNMMMPNPVQSQTQAFNNVRAVTGYEEAIASQIPLDGSISLFTDFSHNRIYIKKLNLNDGTAMLETFVKSENPTNILPEKDSEKYVKQSEFDDLKSKFNSLMESMTSTPKTNDFKPNQKGGK